MADLPAPNAGAADWPEPADDLSRIAGWIRAWRAGGALNRPVFALYAGPFAEPGHVARTRELMESVAAGGAPVSRAVQHLGAGLDVFDLAIDRVLGDVAIGPAMSERECAATMAFGMEALAKQPDLLVVGALGDRAAVTAAGLIEALAASPNDDPLDVLRRRGGRESAAIVGAILAARVQRVPVLLEGYPAAAAAAVLHAIDPGVLAHCRAGSDGGDEACRALFGSLGLWAFDLPSAPPDGTGSAVALCIVKLACATAPPG